MWTGPAGVVVLSLCCIVRDRGQAVCHRFPTLVGKWQTIVLESLEADVLSGVRGMLPWRWSIYVFKHRIFVFLIFMHIPSTIIALVSHRFTQTCIHRSQRQLHIQNPSWRTAEKLLSGNSKVPRIHTSLGSIKAIISCPIFPSCSLLIQAPKLF